MMSLEIWLHLQARIFALTQHLPEFKGLSNGVYLFWCMFLCVHIGEAKPATSKSEHPTDHHTTQSATRFSFFKSVQGYI